MYELNSFKSFKIYIYRTVSNKFVFNSPGVAGAVLQTPLSFIHRIHVYLNQNKQVCPNVGQQGSGLKHRSALAQDMLESPPDYSIAVKH